MTTEEASTSVAARINSEVAAALRLMVGRIDDGDREEQ